MKTLTQLAESYGLALTHLKTLPLPSAEQVTHGLSRGLSGAEAEEAYARHQAVLRGLLSDGVAPEAPAPVAPRAPAPVASAAVPLELPAELAGWRVTCARLEGEPHARLCVYFDVPLRGFLLREGAPLTAEGLLTPVRGEQARGSSSPTARPPLPPLGLSVDLARGERAVALSDDGRGLALGLALGGELEVALTEMPRALSALPEALAAQLSAINPKALSSVTHQVEALGELWRRDHEGERREELLGALDEVGAWSELCTQGALERCEALARALEGLDELDPTEERQELCALLGALVEGRERLERALAAEEALDLESPTRVAAHDLDARARALLSSKANDLAWRALPRPALRAAAPRRGGQWWRALARAE